MTRLDAYKRHADRFGTSGVMAAGADELDFDQLVELQKHIDSVDSQIRYAPKIRLSAETRVKRLLGIPEDEGA